MFIIRCKVCVDVDTGGYNEACSTPLVECHGLSQSFWLNFRVLWPGRKSIHVVEDLRLFFFGLQRESREG